MQELRARSVFEPNLSSLPAQILGVLKARVAIVPISSKELDVLQKHARVCFFHVATNEIQANLILTPANCPQQTFRQNQKWRCIFAMLENLFANLL